MRHSVPVPFVLVALAVVVAGCMAPPGTPPIDPAAAETTGAFVPPIPDFDWTMVVDPDHANHQLPMLHMGGHGLELVGHAGIQDILPPGTRGSITQVDVWGDYAVVSGMEGGMAFAIVDITDPAAPKAVSWFPSTADGWTARFSDDGNYVFYGCQNLGFPIYFTMSQVKGTCEDPDAIHAPGNQESGVIAVDVSDKTAPKFVDFLGVGGSHNIYATSIGGVDTIFTASTAIVQFDRDAGELKLVAEVAGVHDATVQKHPITGDWLLFTGPGELTIYNVNDPAAPDPIFEGAGDEGWVGWHDQVMFPAVVDGRVLLALAGETGTSQRAGVPDFVSIVDITDPTKPVKLSEWHAPWGALVPWTSYLYSVHEMAATPTGQLAISWYHGGVWVIDVSTQERQAEPATLAAYLPNEPINVLPSNFAQTPIPYVPFVWSTAWKADGHLIVPDMHTGVYVLKPEWGLVPAVDSGA